MKIRTLFVAVLAIAGAQRGFAVNAGVAAETDSLDVDKIEEVVVSAVRAQKNAPYAVTNIGRSELQDFSVTGRELPVLFARTPGVLAWGENGLATGTTYMRIRGAGGSRINVTLDGVPLNSPEDQCVFWANMNSYAAILGSAQIQRGVGSSTNGDGAFGGTVALGTRAPSLIPGVEVNASYGSYNTSNYGVQATTGLLRNHFILAGAYYRTMTDGYVHGTSGLSGSYYAALDYLGGSYKLSYKLIGNFEDTGQAWNGVTAGNDDLSIMDGTYGQSTGIRTYADMYAAGLGQFNSLYERFVFNGDGTYGTERYMLKDRATGVMYPWEKTTDSFRQNHHILNLAWNISEEWSTSVSAHYTRGYGYYEEFRPDNKLSKFGLANFTRTDGSLLEMTDFVRRKGLSQDCFGAVGHADYSSGALNVIAGFSAQRFKGNHFGYVTYILDDELNDAVRPGGRDYMYYDSDAEKDDASVYVKASYGFNSAWSVFGDLQYRYVGYRTDGYNDKYTTDGSGNPVKHILDVDARHNFFNPKAGVNYVSGAHRAYASAAISHREPERNNYTDNGRYPAPRAERLTDYELGYQFSGKSFEAGANLYYMDYRDQLVQTGELSDIGEALTTNVRDSYRTGAELTASWAAASWLGIGGNAALSINRLRDFDEYVEDWDSGVSVNHYSDAPLSFSPSAILNGFIDVHHKGFSALWHTGYVSRQYLDNSGNADRSLPGYCVSDLDLNYRFRPCRFVREASCGVRFGNLFSARYAASGWVYSAVYASGGHPEDKRYYQLGFIPAAGFTAMAHLSLKF